MSRLIDADALLEEMIGITDGWREPRKDWKWYEDSVRNAPTIDAIPVEKFCEWLEEHGCSIFKVAFEINVQLFRAAMEKGEKNEATKAD